MRFCAPQSHGSLSNAYTVKEHKLTAFQNLLGTALLGIVGDSNVNKIKSGSAITIILLRLKEFVT